MSDFLSTGVSGLLAYQTALATTGHNISNVNTAGYSRQTADLAARLPQPTGSGFIGSGVDVVGVRRVYDQFGVDQVRTQTSLSSRLDTYHNYASQVDNLLADANAGMAPLLQSFFDALQGVAANPSSIPARQVLLSQAGSLTERFHSVDEKLTALRDSVNSNLGQIVGKINSLTSSIAAVNHNIITASSQQGNGQPPNDLLDQRDELIRQLAELVPVSTTVQDDGAANVFIGNGQLLVIGSTSREISTTRNPYNAFRIEVAEGPDGTGPIISNYLTGGEIGGVLDFRSQVLEPAENSLGRVAAGVALAVNAQHALGLDLNNNVGGEFFNLKGLAGDPLTAYPSSGNTSAAAVTFTFTNASALQASDYRLASDGTTYTLTRLSDNTTVGTFAPGGYPFTYNAATEGLSITVDSAANAGDSFQLEPTRTAANDIGVTIQDTKLIAAAGPLRTTAAKANLGTGKISPATTLNIANANFFNTVNIQMGATVPGGAVDQYSLDGGATWNAFTAGANIDVNGWRVQISGTPLAGDTFTVGKNTNATGDNVNALALAAVQNTGLLSGGTTNLQTAYSQLVSDVGARTHQLDINATAQKSILDQATKAREAVSGVNLDEEAANLVRFQQAYQASAQIINTANLLFQSLLDAVK